MHYFYIFYSQNTVSISKHKEDCLPLNSDYNKSVPMSVLRHTLGPPPMK